MAETTPPLHERLRHWMQAKDNDVVRISRLEFHDLSHHELEQFHAVVKAQGEAGYEVLVAWVDGAAFDGLEIRWRHS